jgi:hypothetical protein
MGDVGASLGFEATGLLSRCTVVAPISPAAVVSISLSLDAIWEAADGNGNENGSEGQGSVSYGLIAGVIVGVCCLLLAAVGFLLILGRRRKVASSALAVEMSYETEKGIPEDLEDTDDFDGEDWESDDMDFEHVQSGENGEEFMPESWDQE